MDLLMRELIKELFVSVKDESAQTIADTVYQTSWKNTKLSITG